MEQLKKILLRVGVIYFLIVVAGVLIMVKAVRLQFDKTLIERGAEISFREESVNAKRGDIFAHDGRLMVTSLPQYQLYLDCMVMDSAKTFYSEARKLSAALSDFFKDKSPAQYEKILREGREKKRRYVKLGNRRIDYKSLEKVYQFPLLNRGWNKTNRTYDSNKSGAVFEQKNIRERVYDRMAFRTLGFRNESDKYVGIEGAFDYELKGTPGHRMMERIGKGDWMPVNSENDVLPHNGYDVVTTLDVDMQDAAETALRMQLAKSDVFEAGTVVIMEVATGDVRAIANMKRNADGTYEEAFNYAIGQSTEPGSTFKLATLITLLEDGMVELDTKVNTGNGVWRYKEHNFTDVTHGGYGELTVQQVFEKSSNVGFAKMAVEYYLGKERRFIDKFYDMKLNEKIGLQLVGEGAPQIPYVDDKKLWSGLSLPMSSMGYGVLLTPIKTLAFYNAVANDGRMVKPKFVKELRQGGEVKKSFPTEVISTSICSQQTLEKVRIALEGVVEHGTAKNIRNDDYRIAGKTGTARIAFENGGYVKDGYRKHQASFAGFFPADNPKYSGVVVLYTGKILGNAYGATWAAPVFKEIADKIYVSHPEWEEDFEREPSDKMIAEVIENNAHHTPLNLTDKKLPSVVGMSLKDALFLLENKGLRVLYTGMGHVVKQSLPEGAIITRGQMIELELR
ncbi:MAG: transpeptidase family protein [Prevotellaceae bacterium]|jgi:cell division protein FtsI (penicillin-binding protein 3)|nr:transpeptidase family protein [Prevotellaceae bacterium]